MKINNTHTNSLSWIDEYINRGVTLEGEAGFVSVTESDFA